MSRPSEQPDEPAEGPEVAGAEPGARFGSGWRLALLLWLGAFVFLLLYELVGFVTGLLRRAS
jgi:hypothetical protein